MKFDAVIKQFRDRNILVVGDLILDRYIWGNVRRISPEAPVPVVEVERESFLLGGAANVANNIVSLGASAAVVGIVGKDMAGEALTDLLTRKGVKCEGIFVSNRPTTVKTRVIAHNQQVVRFDREDSKYVAGKVLRGVLEHIGSLYRGFDAIIVSDYRKGMISGGMIRGILEKSKSRKMFIAVDPKVGHFNFYKGVSVVTPNVAEAASGANIEIRDEKTLARAGRALLKRLGCRAVLVTRGEQGMALFERKGVTHIPTAARKVYDVTGAGDTVISAFTLACAAGASMSEAAVIANHAAGVVVGEVGTAVSTPEQLMESFNG
ncbi:MAG: D-glycero-beta-D-manno-heptose-7-phosphate kinase [Candidatus Sulfobium sp.]|jgi:D-glycero-beta-D-manno-heptose-7-phosphate kinase